MKLRHKVGHWLLRDIPIGQTFVPTKEKLHSVEVGGTVVEAPTEAERWKPIQHGNVIIAEPDIMKEFRRNNG